MYEASDLIIFHSGLPCGSVNLFFTRPLQPFDDPDFPCSYAMVAGSEAFFSTAQLLNSADFMLGRWPKPFFVVPGPVACLKSAGDPTAERPFFAFFRTVFCSRSLEIAWEGPILPAIDSSGSGGCLTQVSSKSGHFQILLKKREMAGKGSILKKSIFG